MEKAERKVVKEVKIFRDDAGKVNCSVRLGNEVRSGMFPDFLLAMYWAEDFLYGEKGEARG